MAHNHSLLCYVEIENLQLQPTQLKTFQWHVLNQNSSHLSRTFLEMIPNLVLLDTFKPDQNICLELIY